MSHSAAHQLWCDDCKAGENCRELLALFDREALEWVGLADPRPRTPSRPVDDSPGVNPARLPHDDAARAALDAYKAEPRPAKPRALLLGERGRLAAASKDEDERPRAGPEDDACSAS